MQADYNVEKVEQTAQLYWEEHQCFKSEVSLTEEKFYCLSMLPYPSGELHMGHVRNYTLGDLISRFQKMQGKNVMQPMGWDAFGLPAENAAIAHNIAPSKWTKSNIATMKAQFKRMGFGFDWDREFATCDPSYYHWEQWLFIQMYKEGLVYRKSAIVNWDPVDCTVLANEQVVDGRGWRSGALIERREIPQWFIKTTAYAKELLSDLGKLKGWPEQVVNIQRNWIGRTHGTLIHFEHNNEPLTAYTTRPDTLMGVTYLAIGPTHALSAKAAKSNPLIAQFIERCQHLQVSEATVATMEKEGMDTGLTATHPLSNETLPIWVTNYVVDDVGTGVVMAVPAHDQRDFEFASKYSLPIKTVVTDPETTQTATESCFTDNGILVNSNEFNGLSTQEAKAAITKALEDKDAGEFTTRYRLRDWGISRQRYWGAPIPMIHCPDCGVVPVPENQLPVELPNTLTPTAEHSPLLDYKPFIETTCPQCHKSAKRETDTFDTFMESSWYYLRYACPDQDDSMLDDRARYWTPVDQYIGGIEHAAMHLIYARFMHKVLRDMALINSDEPFTHLLTQGMVLKDGAKMSKSKGNTVSPVSLIDQYGADTARLFIIFAAPPTQSLEWSDSGVEGCHRFLKKCWKLAYQWKELLQPGNEDSHNVEANGNNSTSELIPPDQRDIRGNVHRILRQANFDMERQQFNTVVSAAMKLCNTLASIPCEATYTEVFKEGFSILLRLLSPITPHIAHVLWQACGFGGNILHASWPDVDESATTLTEITLAVQINGKRRAELVVPADANDDAIKAMALAHDNVTKYIHDKEIKRCIIVPQKLVNIVAA